MGGPTLTLAQPHTFRFVHTSPSLPDTQTLSGGYRLYHRNWQYTHIGYLHGERPSNLLIPTVSAEYDAAGATEPAVFGRMPPPCRHSVRLRGLPGDLNISETPCMAIGAPLANACMAMGTNGTWKGLVPLGDAAHMATYLATLNERAKAGLTIRLGQSGSLPPRHCPCSNLSISRTTAALPPLLQLKILPHVDECSTCQRCHMDGEKPDK